MNVFTIFTILIILAAGFGFVNVKFLKLPSTIGLMLISIVFTTIIAITGKFYSPIQEAAKSFISGIDFEKLLLDAMLSFLLFAGALHTDWAKLKSQRGPIIIISTLGVIASTFIVGTLFYYLVSAVSFNIDYIYCLIFGALISPTDPIAVLGILKEANAPKKLEIKIVGESLFNDGIGVVVFLTLFHIADFGIENTKFTDILVLFVTEVIGGIALGAGLGYIAYRMLKAIDHYETEVIITIALVAGSYGIAQYFHLSGPLAVVIAGLFIGNQARGKALSSQTEKYMDKFWELIDVILNAILFVLIGLEIMILPFHWYYVGIGLITVPLVLLARYVVLSLPIQFFKKRLELVKFTSLIMTWGGLRGGISIALALSIPVGEFREVIIIVTYVIVVFSIIIQGLTLKPLIKKLV